MDVISSTKKKIFNLQVVNAFANKVKAVVTEKFSHLSAEGIGWLAVMFLHCATIPSLLGLIFAVSNVIPSLDVVFFIWGGLTLFFIKALIKKDMLNIITIGFGFIVQAILLGAVVFK